jgi:hypothetical protein
MKPTDSTALHVLCGLLTLNVSLQLLEAADSTPGKSPPAKIAAPTKEADLATLTLTPEAEKRLGIVTVPVERRKLARTRLFGGEVILPANAAGETNLQRQSLFAILPSLSSAELVRMARRARLMRMGKSSRRKCSWTRRRSRWGAPSNCSATRRESHAPSMNPARK